MKKTNNNGLILIRTLQSKNLVNENAGFSLIEILIAIAVAAVIFPAVIILLSFSSFTVGQGENYTKAYTIAQKEMENIYYQKNQNLSWDWTTSPSNSTTTTTDGIFLKTVIIERCIGGSTCTSGFIYGDEITRKITVNIYWSERETDTYWKSNPKVTVESYVTKI